MEVGPDAAYKDTLTRLLESELDHDKALYQRLLAMPGSSPEIATFVARHGDFLAVLLAGEMAMKRVRLSTLLGGMIAQALTKNQEESPDVPH